MKKTWLVVVGLILVLGVVGLAGCNGEGVQFTGGSLELKGNLNSQQEGIWVNGEGKVTAVPDVAILSLGIEVQEVSVADAQEKANVAMDKVMKALKDQDIDEKDIQTQSYYIQEMTRWDDNKNEPIITGYRVSNTVSVKVREIGNTGYVIDVVAAAGGDYIRVNSVGFTVDDPLPYQEQAREMAVKNAADKAAQLAAAAGVKLGNLSYISESTYTPGPIYRTDAYAMAEAAPVPSVQTPVSPGEQEITVSVQMTYAID